MHFKTDPIHNHESAVVDPWDLHVWGPSPGHGIDPQLDEVNLHFIDGLAENADGGKHLVDRFDVELCLFGFGEGPNRAPARMLQDSISEYPVERIVS